MKRVWSAAALFALVGGCDLVNSNSLSKTYAFDAAEFMKQFSGGGSFPQQDCTSNSACGGQLVSDPSLAVSCDLKASKCGASADVRLSYVVDLSSQASFPPEAIRYGVSAVSLQKIAYWVAGDTLNLPTPAIDLYVAPDAAPDDATKLGSVAPLAAKSTTCADAVDNMGDRAAPPGTPVCDLPTTDAGKARLSALAADYKTKFQIIAKTTVTIKSGDPVPSGSIDFFVRPTISIGIHL
jgi:hypothetical protein